MYLFENNGRLSTLQKGWGLVLMS
uniref:Uncharacterized protein n=1 Tax=Anguilla anguilla TaxID=7936 RepID=A0A0E9R757_ANGAN